MVVQQSTKFKEAQRKQKALRKRSSALLASFMA
jgi:hypothetical protein